MSTAAAVEPVETSDALVELGARSIGSGPNVLGVFEPHLIALYQFRQGVLAALDPATYADQECRMAAPSGVKPERGGRTC